MKTGWLVKLQDNVSKDYIQKLYACKRDHITKHIINNTMDSITIEIVAPYTEINTASREVITIPLQGKENFIREHLDKNPLILSEDKNCVSIELEI